MKKSNTFKFGENSLVGPTFEEMLLFVLHPSYLKTEEELTRKSIDPSKQSDTKAIKNGSD